MIKYFPPYRMLRINHVSSSASKDALSDLFGRYHNYLRISLTERCNLRCLYCMPENGVTLSKSDSLLSLDENKRLISLFIKLGVDKIRFTGGEPTISQQLEELIKHTKQEGKEKLQSISITSNGIVLKDQLTRLVNAGLTSVNISLDTLDEQKFAKISRRNGRFINKVLASIFMAKTLNISVKLNCVVIRGFNDDEVAKFLAFGKEHHLPVRFIELMPFDGNEWNPKQFVSYREIIDRLKMEENMPLIKYDENILDKHDTTKWYHLPDAPSLAKVGFITSMSSNFCSGCNRLRITADGNLKVCLFGDESYSLRDAVRKGHSDEEIITGISAAVKLKKAVLGGHKEASAIASSNNRPMILIGG